MPYNSQDENDTPDVGPSIGSIGQANLRKNARRGGTPNAPEVDDEAAPAADGATGIGGVSSPVNSILSPYPTGYRPVQPGQQPQSVAAPAPAAQSIAAPAAPAAPRTYANSASFPDPVDQNTPGPIYSYVPGRPAPAGTVFQSPWVANPSNEAVQPAKAAAPGVSAISSAMAQPAAPPQPVAPAQPAAPAAVGRYASEGGVARGYPTASPPPPGAISRSVADNGVPSFSGVGTAQPNQDGVPDSVRMNAPFAEPRRQIDARLAASGVAGQAEVQNRNTSVNANADWADAWTRNRDAQSADRVARFFAKNSAYVSGSGGTDEQQAALAAEARRTAGERADAEAGLTKAAGGITGGLRNPYEDARTAGETANRENITSAEADQRRQVTNERSLTAPLDLQAKQQQNAVGKLGLEGQQRIGEVAKKLSAATTVKDIDRLSSQLAGLMGKDRPDQYKAYVVHGEEKVDPLTNAKTKDPDRLFLIGPDGKAEDVTAAQAGAKPAGKLPPGTSPEAAIAGAQAQVKAGKMTRDQANAELQSYGITQRI